MLMKLVKKSWDDNHKTIRIQITHFNESQNLVKVGILQASLNLRDSRIITYKVVDNIYVTFLGGQGGERFCGDSTKPLAIRRGRKGVRIVLNCVTLFVEKTLKLF